MSIEKDFVIPAPENFRTDLNLDRTENFMPGTFDNDDFVNQFLQYDDSTNDNFGSNSASTDTSSVKA